MALDGIEDFRGGVPALSAAEAASRARAAEAALIRRLMPGEDWRDAPSGDPAFDAAREAFRHAHALAARLIDEAAEEGDPDAWPEEPFGD